MYEGLASYFLPTGVLEYFEVTDFAEVPTQDLEVLYTTELHGTGLSRAREFHPHPLTEPCVKVSPHTALHTQLFVHRHNLGV